MISEQTEQLLRSLLAAQPTYRPIQAVIDKIQHTNVICFVGASCMGKTTLMDALVQLDPRFGKTHNFTTRPPRQDDDVERYYYFEHSDDGLRPIFERIERHELLQYNINPHTLHVYGSEASGYPHAYNLGDIFSSSIDGFRQLGFGSMRVFTIVTEPTAWQARVDSRFPVGSERREARIKEAITSLEWSLFQTNPDHHFIVDHNNAVQAAAEQVIAIIDGATFPEDEARRTAESCLVAAKELLV